MASHDTQKCRGAQMTNRTAFILAVIIVVLIGLDITLDGSKALTFLLRKLVDAIDYLAFWR
jgi:hypothetical protein